MEYSNTLVTTSIAGEADADRLASSILEARLAACVQILPIRSIYRWEGKVCREPEFLLLIKTKATLYEHLEAHIKANHPYKVAEIIQLPITAGSADYLAWLAESTDQPKR